MPAATITSKGQVTIPKEVRDILAVKTGDVIDFELEPDGTFRVRARKLRVEDLAGLLRRKGRRRVSLEEMDAAIAKGAARGRLRT